VDRFGIVGVPPHSQRIVLGVRSDPVVDSSGANVHRTYLKVHPPLPVTTLGTAILVTISGAISNDGTGNGGIRVFLGPTEVGQFEPVGLSSVSSTALGVLSPSPIPTSPQRVRWQSGWAGEASATRVVDTAIITTSAELSLTYISPAGSRGATIYFAMIEWVGAAPSHRLNRVTGAVL
jgi:hypothetical protein